MSVPPGGTDCFTEPCPWAHDRTPPTTGLYAADPTDPNVPLDIREGSVPTSTLPPETTVPARGPQIVVPPPAELPPGFDTTTTIVAQSAPAMPSLPETGAGFALGTIGLIFAVIGFGLIRLTGGQEEH